MSAGKALALCLVVCAAFANPIARADAISWPSGLDSWVIYLATPSGTTGPGPIAYNVPQPAEATPQAGTGAGSSASIPSPAPVDPAPAPTPPTPQQASPPAAAPSTPAVSSYTPPASYTPPLPWASNNTDQTPAAAAATPITSPPVTSPVVSVPSTPPPSSPPVSVPTVSTTPATVQTSTPVTSSPPVVVAPQVSAAPAAMVTTHTAAPAAMVTTPTTAPAVSVSPGITATNATPVQAFINVGAGPYPLASTITTGGAQPWYNSTQLSSFFGGQPTAQQIQSFDNTILQRVQQTFSQSGISVSLTENPNVPALHTISLVSNTASASLPTAIGMTQVGANGFSFINQIASSAQSLDQLEWIVAHNISHELMLAFGVPENYDTTGNYIDAKVANWSMMVSPSATFSTAAAQAINQALASQDPAGTGSMLGAQEFPPAAVPEPTTLAIWGLAAAGLVIARRRQSARNRCQGVAATSGLTPQA